MRNFGFLDVKTSPLCKRMIVKSLSQGSQNVYSLVMDQTENLATDFGIQKIEKVVQRSIEVGRVLF